MKFLSYLNYGPVLALLGWFFFNIHDALSKSVLNPENYVAVVSVVQITVVFFTLLSLWQRGQLSHLWRCRRWLTLAYSCTSAVAIISFFYVLPRMPFAELFVFALMRPALGVAMSEIFLKEKLVPRQWIGFAIAILAVLINLQIWHLALTHFFKYPPDVLIALVLHVTAGSGGPLLVRRFGPNENPLVLTIYSTLLAIVLLPLFFTLGSFAGFTHLDWARMIMAGGAYTTAMILFLRGFQLGPAGLASGAQYSQMVWTTLIGWLIFNETPNPYTIAGAVLVIGSGILLFWPVRKHSKAVPL